MDLKELINAVEKSEQRHILGIDWLSRSGKTTFVNQFSNILKKQNIPFHIFHIDDHIVGREKRYHTGHEEWYEYYQLQWDIEWLKMNLLKKLRKENQLKLPFYDEKTESQEFRQVTLPKKGLIIVEGVFLQREKWREIYDTVVYLNCSRERRFSREAETTKQNIEKFKNRYWKAENYYLDHVNPLSKADIIINT
ncbi:kinase [Rossellomorea aquimaris]|uniref:kinase n=1 Tax=Rossellomorea aquimaris TaxID=189382 RepID=UPI0012E8F33E|nr:kinase [Rossellomorea aquimaris]